MLLIRIKVYVSCQCQNSRVHLSCYKRHYVWKSRSLVRILFGGSSFQARLQHYPLQRRHTMLFE